MKLEFFIVVTQFDMNPRPGHNSGHLMDGPIVHESYPEKNGTLEECQKRAKMLRGQYGWAYVAKVVMDTEEYQDV